ncbi:PREDICTED: uncharacterized protein LOC104728072 [Camelina sativa]|uniref:Uncharacterized protein LOC104728072 n=1 Tax=Camelina sativa TaxID=90675 RepID=A0ABM0US92_CAMSA|nr:PREDICTED: uncharacterized protein LOC104728072 [Camelina sativa]
MEDPLNHLDEFDRLCGLTKINGVSEDSFKLRLFPFSLGDKAHLWEKTLPTGAITTWDRCKKVFLAKFFSNARTASEYYDRTVRFVDSAQDEKYKKDLKIVNDKLDKILLSQQKNIHFLGDEDTTIQDGENEIAELCYVQNQGGFKPYNQFKPNNLSYRSTNVANPQD